jgi:hypothetical protein
MRGRRGVGTGMGMPRRTRLIFRIRPVGLWLGRGIVTVDRIGWGMRHWMVRAVIRARSDFSVRGWILRAMLARRLLQLLQELRRLLRQLFPFGGIFGHAERWTELGRAYELQSTDE